MDSCGNNFSTWVMQALGDYRHKVISYILLSKLQVMIMITINETVIDYNYISSNCDYMYCVIMNICLFILNIT